MTEEMKIPAGLDAIAREGAALDQGGGGDFSGPGPGDQAPVSEADTWAKLPEIFGGILCMGMPELRPAYSPENCRAWGAAMDAVAMANGWNAATVLNKFGPWPGLIFTSLPMLLPTIAAIKARRAPVQKIPVTVTEGPGSVPEKVPGMLEPVTEPEPIPEKVPAKKR